jgi:TonB family protein
MNNLSKVVFKACKASYQKIAGDIILATAVVCLGIAASSALSWSQQDPNAGDRKVITRIEPLYPATLERLYIGGVVRLEVVVAPNGTVQSTKLIGGNPILGQSAIAAVKQWKYAPGRAETTSVVRLEFDPQH